MFSNGYPYTDFHELNADWIVRNFKQFVDDIASLKDWRSVHEKEYEELLDFMNQLKEGELPPAIYQKLKVWLQTNAYDIIGGMIKHVFFGLTNDGYFCAWIPENWSDIHFDTITNGNDPLYGHLLLLYD